MKKNELELGESVNDSKYAEDTGSKNSDKQVTGRRLVDVIISKHPFRKLNLDRRTTRSDRRVDRNPNYNDPSRRYTIDRRQRLKDRRKDGE